MERRHILLLIGLVICSFSSFFFIQFHEFLLWIWIGAALLLFGCIVAILFGEEAWKRKLLWLGLVVCMIVIAHFTQHIQSTASCRMYIAMNKESLNQIVATVNLAEEDFNFGLYGYHKDTSSRVNTDSLSNLLNDVNAISVSKARDYAGNKYIYIELWGFLDARFGVTYYEKPIPENYYKPIRPICGNWYR